MEFVAYKLQPDEICDLFDLAPARRNRDWMDESPSKFAYRCLPLAIANQLGWTLSCPVSFDAVWNGSQNIDAIDFRFGESPISLGVNWEDYVSSHFGSGIITFSLPYLFRTSPGWGLSIRGAANYIKRGVIPLDAFVETDWHDMTFTMNWKITEPEQRIRFCKGDPICSILPLDIRGYEHLAPEVMSLRNNESLGKALGAKITSRSEFNSRKDRGKEWQKFYFKGEDASGERQENHFVRLTLPPFLEADSN